MARLFRWLTAVNLVGLVVVAMSVLVPGVLAAVFPPTSVEIQLVPIEKARPSEPRLPPRADDQAALPTAVGAPDLSPRPWEVLPDGTVRFRD
ncbi:MAG TPA: hypothetical protein VMJ14_07175 [Burkholderiales bacterium]|nr:hypothetical protein [Burkholderiales bacterium]